MKDQLVDAIRNHSSFLSLKEKYGSQTPPKSDRLKLFLHLLTDVCFAKNQAEAKNTLDLILNTIEDEFSGEPFNPEIGLQMAECIPPTRTRGAPIQGMVFHFTEHAVIAFTLDRMVQFASNRSLSVQLF